MRNTNKMLNNMHLDIRKNISCAKKLAHSALNRRKALYEKLNLIKFSLIVAMEHFTIIVITCLIIELTTTTSETSTIFDKYSNVRLFIMAVLVAPIWETIVFQFSIIELLKKIISNKCICGTISAFIFGYVHIDNSHYGIYYATISGLYLSWGYNHWTSHSRSKAIISTAIQHALYNLTIFMICRY